MEIEDRQMPSSWSKHPAKIRSIDRYLFDTVVAVLVRTEWCCFVLHSASDSVGVGSECLVVPTAGIFFTVVSFEG